MLNNYLNEIQDLIKFVSKAGVSEVEIEKKDFKIVIKSESKKEQIKSKIEYNEDKINALVYQLYNLTEEEIKLIERI